jgi:predicted ABC-type ATPase
MEKDVQSLQTLRQEIAAWRARSPVTSMITVAAFERFQPYPLVLIRGLPGVGKSTLARRYFGSRFLVEADQFFVTADGQYHWSTPKASAAHAWCLATTEAHVHARHQVIVANTFVKRGMISPYIRLMQWNDEPWYARLAVITMPPAPLSLEQLAQRTHASGHAVPLDVLARMHAEWEACEGEYILTSGKGVPNSLE